MLSWHDHLMIVPIVLPMLVAGVMLLLGEGRATLKAIVNVLATFVLLAVAIMLLRQAAAGQVQVAVYLAANWPAPFGISLALDRLSAVMLLLTAIMALGALLYSLARWHRAGVHFHPLFQLQLMGLNGAFLTADLFNLFVFFEILLAASYGLLLHGSGPQRVKVGLHYIAVNLAGSSLFLIGVALIYGVTGSLNMADVAVRIGQVGDADRMLMEAGAAILGVAFLIKAGAWPLNFWLPPSYAAASPPAASLFAIMTKVGVYIILRLSLLMFGANAGASSGFVQPWILYTGLATLVFGTLGMLASQNTGRLAGFAVIISSGTLLSAIGFGRESVTAAALFYLVSSTLALGAFFLLQELMDRSRTFGADLLAVTLEAFGLDRSTNSEEEMRSTEVGVAIPAAMAFLGLAFIGCALVLSGLPPLSGFVAKFALLTTILNPDGLTPEIGSPEPALAWVLLALLIASGLTTVVSLTRIGIRAFWVPTDRAPPRLRVIEVFPVTAWLVLGIVLMVQAQPAMRYFNETARALHQPEAYVRSVLAARQVDHRRGPAP
ncbi:MAG: monovalent cation/H+ antiporter subunit D [Pigmentiphaga sp.]|uniref:monovalent cation/H+ antiporter subunit D n=1 Tax=Pigmentiphaga sp. TaxID=1977564 RepID=UPI0029AB3E6A|nr:monovalent cation/H+ antiporter subunit D [Pigmentiphaga sp.]MDX3905476.1 monovalent cation/H+ antiporter subunit D [Pigmentiphaga sp.]